MQYYCYAVGNTKQEQVGYKFFPAHLHTLAQNFVKLYSIKFFLLIFIIFYLYYFLLFFIGFSVIIFYPVNIVQMILSSQ